MNLNEFDRPEILQEACSLFGIDHEQSSLLSARSNLTYDCGNTILRITHPSERGSDEVIAELDWMQFLCGNGQPVAQIIPSYSGNMVEQMAVGEDAMSVICMEKIEGSKISDEGWDESHFKRLGYITGSMHALAKQYPAGHLHKHWNETPKSKVLPLLPDDERKLGDLYMVLNQKMSQFPISTENYGITHYDLHHGNYLMANRDGRPVFFDFEMTCQNWFMNDVATVLYYALMHSKTRDEKDFAGRFMEHFWEGYNQANYLDESEQLWIPTFLLYRDLLVLGYLHRIWDVSVIEGNDKDFFDRVEASIEERRQLMGL